jgi:dipeptidyl aminopeptidase/acylaminoacyl peptidase
MKTRIDVWVVATLLGVGSAAHAQSAPRFAIDDVIAPVFPLDLVAARAADRIAWIEYEQGRRNVYTAAGPAYERERVTANLADDGVDLSGLQISDDGETVVFLRGHTPNRSGWIANPASDPRGQERAVWAASTRGGAPWRVAAARAFSLSPDGRWVLYSDSGQIYRAAVNPGLGDVQSTPLPLFRAYGNNVSPTWSPDGTRIAFVSERGDHSFIGIYDARSPEVRYLTPGVDRDVSPAWSPDGGRVAFIRRPGLPFGARAERPRELPDSLIAPGLTLARFSGGATWSIWVADAETGQGHELWRNTRADERFAEVRAIRWQGEHIVFEAEPGEWQHWFALNVAKPDEGPVELTPGDGFVEHVSFDGTGEWLYYAANIGDIDRRHLWRVRLRGGKPEQLTDGATIATYPAVPGQGERVAFLHATAQRPLSVAVMNAPGGRTHIVTPLPAEFPSDAQVLPETIVLASPDSVRFHSQLFLPPDLRRGERRPALIFIHGGPRRQMLLGYHYMHFYHMAYALNQYFASKGYVVLSVNYRSGIGYGRAFRTAENVGRNGSAEYQDILTAGLYLRGRPDVDTVRIGLWGLSYGGILTAQGLARNSDVFAAGVDMAGVHFWGETIDPEAPMFRASSISEIAKWRSPVLLIHGDDDRNVAFSQTVGLVQLLRGHDVPFELIVFPDEVHDFLLHRRWLLAFHATDDFFERALIRREQVRAEGAGR